uniref:Uncharacterized protein n=1 Tax=Moniliophthora roreri TaxID=221103 RepID=A0A0W0FAD4_MONRR
MEVPCSLIDATTIFTNVENSGYPILGSFGASVITDVIEKEGERSWKEGEEWWYREAGSLVPCTLNPTPRPSSDAAETLVSPPPHTILSKINVSHSNQQPRINLETSSNEARQCRLSVETDTDKIPSSYPRFRTQTPAPKYAGMLALA